MKALLMATLLVLVSPLLAKADDFRIGFGITIREQPRYAPVYVQPVYTAPIYTPVYVQPVYSQTVYIVPQPPVVYYYSRPVYAQPVYVAPQPVYVYPPAYCPPTVIYYGGGRR